MCFSFTAGLQSRKTRNVSVVPAHTRRYKANRQQAQTGHNVKRVSMAMWDCQVRICWCPEEENLVTETGLCASIKQHLCSWKVTPHMALWEDLVILQRVNIALCFLFFFSLCASGWDCWWNYSVHSALCGEGKIHWDILAGLLCYGRVSALYSLLSPCAEYRVFLKLVRKKKKEQQQKGLVSRKSTNPCLLFHPIVCHQLIFKWRHMFVSSHYL